MSARFLIILFSVFVFVELVSALLIAWYSHKRTQEDLLQQAKEAAYLDLSHEMRTPLTSILLATNEMSQVDAEQQVTLRKVVSVAAENLLNLINDQLDLGQVRTRVKLLYAYFSCLFCRSRRES